MKASLALAALALSVTAAFSAHAQTRPDAQAPVDFTTHKTSILSRIDQRMAAMSNLRACVSAANAPADLKTCHQQNRAAMHGKRAPA